MIKSAHIILLVITLIITSTVTVAGALWFNHISQTPSENLPHRSRPSFILQDLQGKVRSNSEWDGKVVIINFWATWCPPCIREIPLFIEWQKIYAERGLQLIGIAINDQRDEVQSFVESQGINYPILQGKNAINTAINFGNHLAILPFTVIIDRKGNIVWQHPGEVKPQQAEQIILPLL